MTETQPNGNAEHPSDHKPADKEQQTEEQRTAAAARLIQSNYRGYRARRELDGCAISADSRWTDAVHRMRLEEAHKSAKSGRNDTSSRWNRANLLVGQLTGGGNRGTGVSSPPGEDGPVEGGPTLNTGEIDEVNDKQIGDVPGGNEGEKIDNIGSIAKKDEHMLHAIERWTRSDKAQGLSKVMEEQYWLEMVDKKHRYGSNLKYYHKEWMQDQQAKDNFFKWLDEGRGKTLDLDECPRERLDSEKVIYLSAEQRGNYIVDIKDGRLVWRRNGKPVDTAKGKHRDLGEGRGIVDLGEDEQKEEEANIKRRALERGVSESSLSSVMSGSSSSDDEEMSEGERTKQARHYQSKSTGKRRHLDILSPSNWADMLLRKTIAANTWIYVFNSRHELYVGLKKTGYFQHSSFLYGGRVLSAGLLKVDNGRLISLSPLSGHYRAGTAHFRYFVKQMREGGVDLDKVKLSKSLLMLGGIEAYGKMMGKVKGGADKDKQDKDDGEEDGKDGEAEKGSNGENTENKAKEKDEQTSKLSSKFSKLKARLIPSKRSKA